MTTASAFLDHIDPNLVCHAHAQGVRVVRSAPFPTQNRTALLSDPKVRAAWVAVWMGRIKAQGIDGLTLDIEQYTGLPAPLTALVTELYTAMKAHNPHLQLSFALGIFPDGQASSYNHADLSKVLDFIIPMCYDEPWGSKVAAANAPLASLKAGVAQYAKRGVSASKLVMGLPWYGWDYPCTTNSSTTSTSGGLAPCNVSAPPGRDWYGWATQVGYADIVTTLHSPAVSGVEHTDNATVTRWFEYAKPGGAGVADAGRHQLWFDDPTTLEVKYAACKEMGLRGVGFWTANFAGTAQGPPMWAAITKGFPSS